MNAAEHGCFQNTLHLVFDFSKGYFALWLRNPRQLHFVTGLNFDLFGIIISIWGLLICIAYQKVTGLVKNSANNVASVLHYFICMTKTELAIPV